MDDQEPSGIDCISHLICRPLHSQLGRKQSNNPAGGVHPSIYYCTIVVVLVVKFKIVFQLLTVVKRFKVGNASTHAPGR